MQNKHTLWIFPLLTQTALSVIAGIIDGFSLEMCQLVFFSATLPSVLLAAVCVKFNYHQNHLFPLGFFAGVIGFFYTLLLVIYSTDYSAEQADLLENSLMALLYALTYACSAILYSLLVLRLFLRKKSANLPQ